MKTLAIRLEDDLHAQLSGLAQLSGSTITDIIRGAIEAYIESQADNPELTAKAQAAIDAIEREAEAKRAAIATMFGSKPERGNSGGRTSGSKRGTAPKSE